MSTATKQIEELANTEYKYGFVTDTEQDIIPVGLNEDVVRLISSKSRTVQSSSFKLRGSMNTFAPFDPSNTSSLSFAAVSNAKT